MNKTQRLVLACFLAIAATTGVMAGSETGSLNTASTVVVNNVTAPLVQGADGATGTATVFRGGNGSAGAGGLCTLQGGHGVGTNQGAGGGVFSTGLSTGTGTADLLFQSSNTLASGTTVQTITDRYRIVGKVKTLSTTTATLTAFCNIVVGTSLTGGGGTCYYTVVAASGSAADTACGHFDYTIVNVSGTLTVTAGTITDVKASSSGSITSGVTITKSGTTATLNVTPAFTTIVPTSCVLYWQIVWDGTPVTLSVL